MRSRTHSVRLALVVMVLVSIALAQREPIGTVHTISAVQVSRAFSAKGIRVVPEQVDFLSPVPTSATDADVRVVSVARLAGDTFKVRMRCQNNECLPFYVLLRGVNFSEEQTRQQFPRRIVNQVNPKSRRVVRSGERVTLIVEGKDLRITLPVICLQNGALGQKIRVSSSDHKKIYIAEVTQAGLLKSTL
jgi:hypothetical protein